MRTTAALLGALVLGGCARLQWSRVNVDEPIADEQLTLLEPDRDDLDACLRVLGAPLRVWEGPDQGVVLAYGWLDNAGWGFNISYSFERLLSVSFDWSDQLSQLRGAVLVLDSGLMLRQVRRGWLRDITGDLRRRPATVAE